jgi:hypothetical protein
MGKIVSTLLGGGSTPKVSQQPVADTKEEKRSASNTRSALYATEGGASGATLDPAQVKKRDTLLGN